MGVSRYFCVVKQLLQVVAVAAIETGDHQAAFDFAAGGFKDFTRVASSDPVMWRNIALANDKELGALLTDYRELLDQMIARLDSGDGDYLQQLFHDAKIARDTHLVGPR